MARVALAMVLLALVLPLPMAAASPATSRFLVSFDGDVPAVGQRLAGADVLEAFPFAGVALLEGPTAVRGALAALPFVAGVYDEEPISLTMERERTLISAEPPAGARWPVGGNVTVALVDSGIDASHPAFSGRVSASVRISRGGLVSSDTGDADGHGTHVAGIVAGDGAGSPAGRQHGIAPAARLVGVDISDSFTTTNAVRAFAWIAENAQRYDIRVVSNSWGREKDDAHYDPADPVIRASDALVDQGIVVIFSAGNRGRDGDATLTSEATNPRVITVGAAGSSGRVESYSSRGPPVDSRHAALSWTKPDLVAPGTAVVSARASVLAIAEARGDEERYYTVMNGTSMAAPQVAGAVALLLDLQSDLSPAEVQALLQQTAQDLGPSGADDATGYGMLDVAAALREASYLSAGERRVVVETHLAIRKEGTMGAALGAVVLTAAGPALPPAASVTIPLVLPPGAANVELWLNWSSEGALDARLIGPAGTVVFQRMGGQSLHVDVGASTGAWRVEIVSTGPLSYTPYVLAGDITVREERVVEIAAESHGRALRSNGAFQASPIGGMATLEVVARAPWLALALAGIGASAVALKMQKKQKDEKKQK